MSQLVLHTSEFVNEPFTDFSKEENIEKMKQALAQVKSELGKEYPLTIGSEKIYTEKKDRSLNPANLDEVVGIAQLAEIEHAEKAIQTAHKTFETWKKVAPEERASYLFRAADLIRERKFYYSALMVYEVGKNWAEADGDTAEAIDFLEFYGREMLRYSKEQPITKINGENNKLVYLPLGVGIVIPPWNFPLAIMAGTTVASLVTGNTVVLKPSQDAPIIAAKFFELLQEVGLPEGVVNFLTGDGAVVGDYLTTHPLTRFISFTGSMEVGLRINEKASVTQKGQKWIKRVVAEMGGKDAIVVDNEADLEDAANGIVASAFGFQGQKCSACSRAIVVESVYDEVLAKVKEKASKLAIGNPDENKPVGPVSSQRSINKIMEYIEIGKQEGKLELGGKRLDINGYFVEPTIFSNIDRNARLAQEEIFGPVLAFIKAKDFDDALEVANNTKFGLTGALYTKNPEKLKKGAEEFFVGNLYLNRKCTGALVGVHPFGGFNMSGTDSKAGGRDYLLLFMQAKMVSEKI
ncbi:MAG: L-glutamate gamma-semialdehyde dehydrogenase [Candidatus Sericytochromatia bacterium]